MEQDPSSWSQERWLRETSTVNSTELFRKKVRTIQFLEQDVQDALFEVIRESPDGATELAIIAEAHVPLAVACAFDAWNKADGDDMLDELMEESFVILMECMHTFARLKDDSSFAPYFRNVAQRRLPSERHRLWAGRKLDTKSDKLRLRAFWAATKKLAKELGYPPTAYDIADELGEPVISVLETVSAVKPAVPFSELGSYLVFEMEPDETNILDDILYTVSERQPPLPKTTPAEKMILVERGLEMMSPGFARCLILSYGLFGEPAHHEMDDLMQAMELGSVQSANAYLRQAKEKFGDIVKGLVDGSLDLVQWHHDRPAYRNVLSLLAIAGVSIPPRAELTNLRFAAMRHMQQCGYSGRDLTIMAELYGLHNGQKSLTKQLPKNCGYIRIRSAAQNIVSFKN